MTEKITPQSPVIRLPQSYHRRAKAFAALNGVSLREAICRLIDEVFPPCTCEVPGEDPRQLTIPGSDNASEAQEG